MRMVSRLPLVTVLVVAAWTAGGLLADQHVDRTGQLALGVFTAGVLVALLVLHPPAVRLQALAVVGIATLGEVVGSIIWGVYTYRLENLPRSCRPGTASSTSPACRLRLLAARRPALLLGVAVAGATVWAVLGVTVLPVTDVSGAIGCTFLVVVLLVTRRPVYAGVFVVVGALEIYGTAVGTWTWQPVVPGLGLPQGNPPSGAASGYVVFDVVALTLIAQLAAATAVLQSRRGRRSASSTTAPALINSRAESTLPQTSQSRNPRALPSPST